MREEIRKEERERRMMGRSEASKQEQEAMGGILIRSHENKQEC